MIIKNFFGTEESGHFDCSVFRAVGSVDDVFLSAHTEVAADSSGSGGTAVSSAGHSADNGYGVLTFEHHNDNGGCHHGFEERGEEGAVYKVCVMLAKELFGELHHFDAGYTESFTLETDKNVANKAARYRGRFENYKGLLHGRVLRRVNC